MGRKNRVIGGMNVCRITFEWNGRDERNRGNKSNKWNDGQKMLEDN